MMEFDEYGGGYDEFDEYDLVEIKGLFNQVARCSETPPRHVLELSIRAVYNSTAINVEDRLYDKFHYKMGMLGKKLILEGVKQQAIEQSMNPDKDLKKLDWENIFRNLKAKAPTKLRDIILVDITNGDCLDWCERRIEIYKEYFPNYDHFHGTATDHLIRYYGCHILALREYAKCSNGMWTKLIFWNLLAPRPIMVSSKEDKYPVVNRRYEVRAHRCTKDHLLNNKKYLSAAFFITEGEKVDFLPANSIVFL